MRIMLGFDSLADMLLCDPLYRGPERTKVLDVACVSEDSGSQCVDLSAVLQIGHID